MEKFDLDIHKQISLQHARDYYSRITKTHYRMHVSRATPNIMRLFASLNFHYNKNTKVQKQNET